MNTKYYREVTSTNDAAREDSTHETVIWADSQTKGRGQRGNGWESEAGKNLTFSITVRPSFMIITDQFYLSKVISLAVIDTLKYLEIEAMIKWPNDIYVGDKKICGILIENDISPNGRISLSIIGVGLNINQEVFLSDAPNPISVKNITNIDYNREEVLGKICASFQSRYNMLKNEDDFHFIDNEYIKHLYRYGEFHKYTDKNGAFSGRIVDVADSGEIYIERENREIDSYLFKEVKFIICDNIL